LRRRTIDLLICRLPASKPPISHSGIIVIVAFWIAFLLSPTWRHGHWSIGLLKRHRPLLEALASAKYDRDGSADDGMLHVTADDLMTMRSNIDVVDHTEETWPPGCIVGTAQAAPLVVKWLKLPDRCGRSPSSPPR
jgi:hypothetical protein